jgi:S1-C subfamily serine protease
LTHDPAPFRFHLRWTIGNDRDCAVCANDRLVVAALGFGAVQTGVVHVPGFGPDTAVPATSSVIQAETPDARDNSSKTVGAGLVVLTPEYAKSHQLATKRTEGYLVTAIVPGSPAEDAGMHVNDVVLAIDGVPIGHDADAWNVKARYTAVGAPLRLTNRPRRRRQ